MKYGVNILELKSLSFEVHSCKLVFFEKFAKERGRWFSYINV